MPRLVIAVLTACLACACVHSPHSSPDVSSLKGAVDTFHQRVRWKDYRGAEELLVPERRDPFDDSRRKKHDDRDLEVTDYQLEDTRMSEDNTRAVVLSRISWMRLPSVTENTDEIKSEFVWRDGTWLLARQQGGPFDEELSSPYTPPDAGS